MLKKEKYITKFLLLSLLLPSLQTISVFAEEIEASVSSSPVVETTPTIDNKNFDLAKPSENTPNMGSDLDSSSDKGSIDSPKPPQTNNDQSAGGTSTKPDQDNKETPSPTPPSGTPKEENPVTPNSSNKQIPTPNAQPQPTPSQPQDSSASIPLVPSMPAVTNKTQTSPFNQMPEMPSAIAEAGYVEHWSGDDAYTHNLMSHRYGITAHQLDSFLESTGINYDRNRVNGSKLLKWERFSGLDVRAIVAIAIAESSLGTQGVAREAGANMFGYGAFDYAPQSATAYSDERAVIKMAKETIMENKNTSFAIQDKKAQKLSMGLLNLALEGGVYYTDTSGTGKKRAELMEKLDQWIDQHGGTPAIPDHLQMQSSSSVETVPKGYKLTKLHNIINYTAETYPWGQCTWYVYNRAQELGYHFDPFMGNGGTWKHKSGYETSDTPQVGYAVSFSPGQAGADLTYGHVAIVEEVKEDGSILISESNCMGLGTISYRTFTAEQASMLTYVIGQK